MAEKAGLDGCELIKLWGESDFRSPIIEGAGGSMLKHDFGVSFHLRTMVKDTELIRNYSESIGVPVLLSNIVHELNKVCENKGWGDLNASAIFKLFEEMAGVPARGRELRARPAASILFECPTWRRGREVDAPLHRIAPP